MTRNELKEFALSLKEQGLSWNYIWSRVLDRMIDSEYDDAYSYAEQLVDEVFNN